MKALDWSWIADNALNALAYAALRLAPPIKVKEWVDRLSVSLGTITTVEEARTMIDRLGNRGTCLSRSIAIAGRCPDAAVVIGVASPGRRENVSRGRTNPALEAHAWVEIHGRALPEEREVPWVEVGRLTAGQRRESSAMR